MSDKQPRPRRRWLQGVLVTFAGVLLAVVGIFLTRNFWLTLIIERYANETGMQVAVKGVALGRALTLEELTVTDPAHPQKPLAHVEGLRVGLALLGGYTLAVEEVTARRAEIDWHQSGRGGEGGIPLLSGASRGGSRPAIERYLPYSVRIDALHVSATTPEGSFSAGPLAIEARLKPSKTAALRVTGTPAIHAEGPNVPQPIDVTGPISVVAERTKDGIKADISASQPGVLEMETHVNGTFKGRSANLDMEFAKGTMAGPLWPTLATALAGVPVSFEKIETAPGASINLSWNGGLPEFKSASASLSTPHLRVGPEEAPWVDSPMEISFVPPVDGAMIALSLRAGKEVAVDAALTGILPPTITATLKNVTISSLAKAFPAAAAAREAVPALREIGGKAKVTVPVFTLEAALTGKLAGVDAGLVADAKYVMGKLSANAALGEGTKVAVKPFTYEGGVAAYTLSADLLEAGGLLGLEGWGGTIEAQGEVTPSDPALPGKFEAKLLNIVSDYLRLPYELPLTVSATHSRDLVGGMVRLKDLSIRMEDHAEVSARAFNVAWPAFTAAGEAILYPPFFAWQGLLDSGTGKASLKTITLLSDKNGLKASSEFFLQAEELVMPETMAVLHGVRGNGGLGWNPAGLLASGSLSVAQLICAGAMLEDATGTLRAEGNTVYIDQIKGTLFGGAVAGTLSVEPLAEGLPMRLDARLEGGDLAVFTTEVQPPGVNLTGSVAGDVLVGLRGEDFTELNIDLEAPGGITINKGLVQQMLMSNEMSGFTGSKTVGKVLDKIVGGEEQRPFDAAQLKLGLAEGRIAGTAYLKSKALNLDVDITADPGAVWEAIQSRGSVSLGDVSAQ